MRRLPRRWIPVPLQLLGVTGFKSDLRLIQSKADLVLHSGWKLLQVRLARTDPEDRLQRIFNHVQL